jgi:hypothetical protein
MAVEYYLGETWTFDLDLNDAAGQAIPLAGATVEFGIAELDGTVLVTRTSPATVTDASAGKATVSIQPGDQTGFKAPAKYIVQSRVTMPDGAVSHQIDDTLSLLSSIFV